jgi:hypothetical protein
MARTKAKSVKPKFSAEVAEIFSQLKKNDGVKLSMLKEATLIKQLSTKHKLKPAVIQKETKLSMPHVYNLINLASMSPRMKAYVKAGKLRGTDALSILRKAKDEKEFIKMADQLLNSKIDRRLKENKETSTPAKRKEEVSAQPKRGRGRPRKEKTEATVKVVATTQPDSTVRREKIKALILNFLGNKISKSKNNSINELVENLIAN